MSGTVSIESSGWGTKVVLTAELEADEDWPAAVAGAEPADGVERANPTGERGHSDSGAWRPGLEIDGRGSGAGDAACGSGEPESGAAESETGNPEPDVGEPQSEIASKLHRFSAVGGQPGRAAPHTRT